MLTHDYAVRKCSNGVTFVPSFAKTDIIQNLKWETWSGDLLSLHASLFRKKSRLEFVKDSMQLFFVEKNPARFSSFAGDSSLVVFYADWDRKLSTKLRRSLF